jgi:hypothetical protein
MTLPIRGNPVLAHAPLVPALIYARLFDAGLFDARLRLRYWRPGLFGALLLLLLLLNLASFLSARRGRTLRRNMPAADFRPVAPAILPIFTPLFLRKRSRADQNSKYDDFHANSFHSYPDTL